MTRPPSDLGRVKRFVPDLRAWAMGGTVLFLLTVGVVVVAERVKARDLHWFAGELSCMAVMCFAVAWIGLAGIRFGKRADDQAADYEDKP
ncbi:MAG TPA: hypothetical protein VM597_27010 [Gemmataceae bacterium]|jgi:hypothetical protein|nr:hypothetical protein [Gemmataceae bacterium]